MSPSTVVPAPIRLSSRFCGGCDFFRSNMGLSYERFKLRVALGVAWPASSTLACSARQLAARRDADRAFDALIILEFELQCGRVRPAGRRAGRVIAGRPSATSSPAASAGRENSSVGLAAAHDEQAVVIASSRVALRRQALDRDRALLAAVAEQLLQEGELLLDLRVLALEFERLLATSVPARRGSC